jgi:molybdopterin molybdotransferase
VGAREAARIFTGGALPPGADAVVIQENAEVVAPGAVRFAAVVAPGTFVRGAGLDFAAGWKGLAAGAILDGRALGLAAAMGHAWLPVRRQPRVALLATGDELRWPGETPQGSQVVSSNVAMLGAMLTRWGARAVDLGICRDDADALAERVRDAAGLDVLVTTGGASVGDHDLVQAALGREGLALGFWKVAMRPGKPLLFGSVGALHVLGFPGNPVSAGVCAVVFLRMALQKMLGLPLRLCYVPARLGSASWAANDQRQDYLRGTSSQRDGERWVEAAPRQDSSMLATFAAADALVVRPPFDPTRKRGDIVSMIDLHEALDSLR